MRIGLVRSRWPTSGRAVVGRGDDPLLESLCSGEEMNRAVLSGLIAAEPRRDTSRQGIPITVLWVSFDAPDEPASTSARWRSSTRSPMAIEAGSVSVGGSGSPVN